MSEKGQGEASVEGTGAGTGGSVDGTPAAGAAVGGGSQADQSGPGDDPLGGLTPSDFPPPPTPAGGPDAEGGSSGSSEPPSEPAETPDQAEEREARRQRGYDDAMRRRAEREARENGPQVEPPPLDGSLDVKGTDESSAGSYMGDDEKPVLS